MTNPHNRAQRLNGLFPLSYMGVNPVSPQNFVIYQRPPNQNDSKNFYIGDIWLDNFTNLPNPPTVKNLWILVSLNGDQAKWIDFVSGSLQTLTGNSGGPVPPDINNNINVVGDGTTITIVGNPGTNTLTASVIGGLGFLKTLTGNSGGAIPPDGTGTINVITANATPVFSGAGHTETLDFGLTNLALGSSLPALTSGTHNCSIGNLALSAVTSGGYNFCGGDTAGSHINSGADNTAIGAGSLLNLTTGNANSALGFSSGFSLVTGSENILIGPFAGSSYTTSESSNIIIGNTGTVSESNVIRIGKQGSGSGQQNETFIAGITGVDVGSVADVVSIDTATGQLGTTTITAGSNITITPGANTITIASTGGGPTYSTGTFVPGISIGGSSVGITYSVQAGYYVRIGAAVIVTLSIILSSKGGLTGKILVTNLPFTVMNMVAPFQDLSMQIGNGITLDAGYTWLWARCNQNTTVADLNEGSIAGGSFALLYDTNLSNNAGFTLIGTYYTSA